MPATVKPSPTVSVTVEALPHTDPDALAAHLAKYLPDAIIHVQVLQEPLRADLGPELTVDG